MSGLVECVPNFSEGRRMEVVDKILDAIRSVKGVQLLDYSSDGDHNRTVATFVGSPEAVEDAAFRVIARAAELIDMDAHTGAHPRLGATDVVPFVPIRDVSMADCVAVAQRLGERVGRELSIPVYLYEAAATRSDRQNLADVRRGEYEGLKQAIASDPDRVPDFGPREVGKAGATVIGARPFLVAYNVYLDTDDVSVAKKIAKVIRYSSGGYRHVKSLGLLVDGKAQVSINFTDFTHTAIYRVQETIRREAERYGAQIAFAEVIGMIPQAALIDAARWYLQLDRMADAQILENRLRSAETSPIPADFLDAVADPRPAPGGGAVAALAGALAAALAEMVGALTFRKDEHSAAASQLRERATEIRQALTRAVDDDIAAYTQFMEARQATSLDSDDGEGRSAAIQRALIRATDVPGEVAKLSFETLQLCEAAAAIAPISVLGDVGAATHIAQAALGTSILNVRINAKGLTDHAAAEPRTSQLARLSDDGRALSARILALIEEKAQLTGI